MTEEGLIKEVIIASTPPAAPKSGNQQMDSPDTATDCSSVPPDLLKRKEKPVPHYLRASSRSSCHENCKYGTHHSPESKKHQPVRPRRRASTGNQGIDGIEILLPKGARPTKDQKLKISHVKGGNAPAPAKPVEPTSSKAPQEPDVPDRSESICCGGRDLPAEDASGPGNLPTDAECFVVCHGDEASDGAESIELEMPLAIQDSDASDENVEDGVLLAPDNVSKDGAKSLADPVSDRSANTRASASSDVRNALTVMKHEHAGPGTEPKNSADEPVKLKKAALRVPGNTATVQKSRRTSLPKAAAVADSETASDPKPVRARAVASVTTATANKLISKQRKTSTTVTSVVPKVREIKVPSSPSNATGSSAKPARMTKPKGSTAKNAPSPSLSSEKQADRKVTVKNVAKNAQAVQKQRDEKVKPRSLKLSRSVNLSAKSLPSVKVRAVKKEKIAPPIESSKKVSGTDGSAADAKDGKERSLKPASLKMRKADSVKVKESQTHKETTDTPAPRRRTLVRTSKPTPITSSTVTPPPRKLTFRRGKVLNPDEGGGSSSTPMRRLRFRPAAAAAADASVLRSRGSKGTGRSAAGARGAATSRAEVVVLRRRQGGVSVDEKKKKQAVLLNNVIEETASRLVSEARKSKVKALVGAFETVISLQEGSGKAGPPAAAVATTAAQ